MSEAKYTLHFVAWKKEGTSDKVWGLRGARLTFKQYKNEHLYSMETMGRSKVREGYVECPITHIEAHTPGFTNEFELQFVMSRMMNKFHGENA